MPSASSPRSPKRLAAYVLAVIVIASLAAGLIGTFSLLSAAPTKAGACLAAETQRECRARTALEARYRAIGR